MRAFDLLVTIFGAMFAPRQDDVAKEMVRVIRPGGRIVMGNWIPGDPTLVAQILRISASYAPPPPQGFVSPMTWGDEETVRRRFNAAGIFDEDISCERAIYTFHSPLKPRDFLAVFRDYYGPSMNAFEAAAKAGVADQLTADLIDLFEKQNRAVDGTKIPATFLKVTVNKRA